MGREVVLERSWKAVGGGKGGIGVAFDSREGGKWCCSLTICLLTIRIERWSEATIWLFWSARDSRHQSNSEWQMSLIKKSWTAALKIDGSGSEESRELEDWKEISYLSHDAFFMSQAVEDAYLLKQRQKTFFSKDRKRITSELITGESNTREFRMRRHVYDHFS